MLNINSWNDIQWPAVEQYIFRLQLRIYKAAMNKELDKMYKLQNLLLSSNYAKFLSVKKITEYNSIKKIFDVDKKLFKSAKYKFELANRLIIDGKSSPIKRTYRFKSDGSKRPIFIITMEEKDLAKQMLSYLALCPQWEAYFEANSFGFRPGRSVMDAIEAVWLGLKDKEKWILNAEIKKCFKRIDENYLIENCKTFPKMRNQIKSWLKAGILDGENYLFPEMGTPQGSILSPLLVNIALHGIQKKCDDYINTLGGNCPNNREALVFIRYGDSLVLMHTDKQVLEGVRETVQDFLKPIGLELHRTTTSLIHSKDSIDNIPPGFTFLGFDILHTRKWKKMSLVFNKKQPTRNRDTITLITPSKEEVKRHKSKLRITIRKYKSLSQERLIEILNPIIKGWALSKRAQMSSKIFQDLDAYLWMQLWNWARQRHPKMSKIKLKEMYWHIDGKSNWKFGIKKDSILTMQLQLHSKIKIQRHFKVKNTASPFDGNRSYWTTRIGKSALITSNKARLI